MKVKATHFSAYVSPWIIIGSAVILLAVLAAMAVNSYNRENRYMANILLEKGSALIKSFEAGTRTGMMAMGWGERQVQFLMEEIADQADVLYIAVTDTHGKIRAHSNPERIGTQFHSPAADDPPDAEQAANWRLTDTPEGIPAFEVYRIFNPYAGRRGDGRGAGRMQHMRGGRHMMGMMGPRDGENGEGGWCAPSAFEEQTNLIFIGFDRSPFIEARRQDFRNTAVISSVVVVLGFAGFTSMLIARRYRSTRRRLQDTSAMADEVVSGLPAGLIVTDHHGVILLANPAALSITAMTEADLVGRPAADVLPENLAGQVSSGDSHERVTEKEIECTFSGKGVVPLSVSSAAIVNEDGIWVGSLVIFRDLTEIMGLRREMQRKEKLAAIGELAAGVAHEIRNPLSSVKGMATYFKNRFENDTEAAEAAKVMVEETDRLNRVINELLEFARPSQIHARPADINEVLEHSVRLTGRDAESRGIGITVRKGKDLPEALIDADRFLQCLLNLYGNAIQAMEEGGEIQVESKRSEEGGIRVRIADTGSGIRQEDLVRIFDPYFTTKPSGTGLGLAIVHKIVEDHGGRITVHSTPDKGTEFLIDLPSSGRPDKQGA